MSLANAPFPLLLDASRLIWRFWGRRIPTGIDRTCLAYLAHYGPRARLVVQRQSTTLVLSARRSAALAEALCAPGGPTRRQIAGLVAGAVPGGGRSAELAGMPYLNVGHTGLDQPGHERWVREKRVRPVYFVHDLIPLTHPEYCRPGEEAKHDARMMQIVRNAALAICNSHATREELAAFAQGKGIAPLPSVVAPLGIDAPAPLAADHGLAVPTDPYFVMLGTIEARKNHVMILQMWAELARRLGPACPRLVVIGQRGWECEQAVDLLDRAAILRGLVQERPGASDGEVSALLNGARALLFPSFAEGYGLPLMEALALGTPVIASDLPVFRELAGDRPDYLHPIDGLGWMRAVTAYAGEPSPARQAQRERIRGFAVPDWPDHFRIVDDAIARLSAGH